MSGSVEENRWQWGNGRECNRRDVDFLPGDRYCFRRDPPPTDGAPLNVMLVRALMRRTW